MSTLEDIELSSNIDKNVKIDEHNNDLSEIEPTDEELNELEHVSERIPATAWLVVVCELCERFAFYGLAAPFQNYIQYPVPGTGDKQPGALDRGQRTATSLTTFFQFFAYLTPIAGAIVSDQYLGKYKTILFSCLVYMFGILVLVLTSMPPSIKAGAAFPGLIIAMIIIGFGTGGVKSNVSPLMAEQYTRTKPIVKVYQWQKENYRSKNVSQLEINCCVLIEINRSCFRTVQSMFNWFYWAINLGALSSIITTNTEKYHSFWLAYLIPLVVFFGSIIVLFIGRNKYIQRPSTGSLLIRACRVLITAIRMRFKLGKQSNRQNILDYAKVLPEYVDYSGTEIVVEKNENLFIDDLKQAFRACRVFAFYPFYWICYSQLMSNLVSQASQMNVGFLPNDILQNIDPIVLIIFIPIFDKIIYPTLRRFNIKFSSIPRITCGFLCAALTMGWAALVQHLIYSTGPNYDFTKPCSDCQKFNNITVAWQIPSYFFLAISEIFASITGLEYAFTQAPASMKSIVMSLFLFTSALGNALNFALIPATVNPNLLWMYTALSILAFVVGIIFFIVFRNEEKRQQTKSGK